MQSKRIERGWGVFLEIEWSDKISMMKGQRSRNLKDLREAAIQVSGKRVFQAD